MFLTSPYIDQAITRFDRSSMSAIGILRQGASRMSDAICLVVPHPVKSAKTLSTIRESEHGPPTLLNAV
jgi:hypothetical protein